MGVNSLPKTVSRHRRDCDLNPGPTAPESSTLTTWLPSHPQWLLRSFNCSYVYSHTLVISFLWNLFFQKGLSVFATFCVWYHVSITSLHLLTINLITCIEIYALSVTGVTQYFHCPLCAVHFCIFSYSVRLSRPHHSLTSTVCFGMSVVSGCMLQEVCAVYWRISRISATLFCNVCERLQAVESSWKFICIFPVPCYVNSI